VTTTIEAPITAATTRITMLQLCMAPGATSLLTLVHVPESRPAGGARSQGLYDLGSLLTKVRKRPKTDHTIASTLRRTAHCESSIIKTSQRSG
jgi:hypothetical protein